MASVSLIGLVQPALASLVESVLLQFFQILAESLACHGHDVQMKNALNFLHDCGYAACIVEELRRPSACRTDIQQIVCASVEFVKCLPGDLNPVLMRDCRNMHQCIC